MDIRQHFIREYIEDDIIKLKFIRSEENDADQFTKKIPEELFKKHTSKLVEDLSIM
jgi:hypothetical protein